MNRRVFLKCSAGSAALSVMTGCKTTTPQRTSRSAQQISSSTPSYLKGYESLYKVNPRQGALEWFKHAGYGLHIHYGLYSLLGRGEWVLHREKIPLDEYDKLKNKFTAEEFDADFITDLALKAEMKYINFTSRHCDSFCLFDSKATDFNSVRSPAQRDLVGELAQQCQQKGLGLFLYYAYALDWRHPYFYPRRFSRVARPAYDQPEKRYLWRRDEDFQHYIDFVHIQIRELLTNYGPIAGIWLDPIVGYYARPDLFPVEQTYAMIRQIQPQTLISFKQGATGTEDFAAPERSKKNFAAESIRKKFGPESAKIALRAWQKNKDKHNEICETLQPKEWGYVQADDSKHHGPDKVMEMRAAAHAQKCNLLLNTGPLADGFIHTDDVKTLLEVGRRIRREG